MSRTIEKLWTLYRVARRNIAIVQFRDKPSAEAFRLTLKNPNTITIKLAKANPRRSYYDRYGTLRQSGLPQG